MDENQTQDRPKSDPRDADGVAGMKEKLYAEAESIRRRKNEAQMPDAFLPGTLSASRTAWPPSLRERVQKAWHHADHEASKRAAFLELNDLLQKNPAVARILELIESTGV